MYNRDIARQGGAKVAEILGTKILDNESHSMTNCCLVNILLPIVISDGKRNVKGEEGMHVIPEEDRRKALLWIHRICVEEYDTFMPTFPFQGECWVRLSGQIYLTLEDFEWAGGVLKKVCERVGRGEYKS